jgi:hypothetical protein
VIRGVGRSGKSCRRDRGAGRIKRVFARATALEVDFMQDPTHGGQPPYSGGRPPLQGPPNPPAGGTPPGSPLDPPPPPSNYTPTPAPQRQPLIIAGIAVAAILALAVAFTVGRISADTSGAEQQGKAAGAAAERAALLAEFEEGGAGYEQIFETGFAAGAEEGKTQGLKQGEKKGKEAGVKQGKKEQAKKDEVAKTKAQQQSAKRAYDEAMGGYSDWSNGGFYVIQIKNRTGETAKWVPTTIAQHLDMREGFLYGICENEPNQICRYPNPAPTSAAAETIVD